MIFFAELLQARHAQQTSGAQPGKPGAKNSVKVVIKNLGKKQLQLFFSANLSVFSNWPKTAWKGCKKGPNLQRRRVFFFFLCFPGSHQAPQWFGTRWLKISWIGLCPPCDEQWNFQELYYPSHHWPWCLLLLRIADGWKATILGLRIGGYFRSPNRGAFRGFHFVRILWSHGRHSDWYQGPLNGKQVCRIRRQETVGDGWFWSISLGSFQIFQCRYVDRTCFNIVINQSDLWAFHLLKMVDFSRTCCVTRAAIQENRFGIVGWLISLAGPHSWTALATGWQTGWSMSF